MAFHRRKLLDPATYCKPSCDAAPKLNGYCPPLCFDVCPPDTCTEQSPPPPPPLPPPPPPPASSTPILARSPPLSLLLIASLAVLATAFFIFTCYTIYKFYSLWRKSRRRGPPPPPEEDGDSLDGGDDYGPVVDHPIWYIRTVGLQPSVINSIAIVKYRKSDGLVDGTDCAVCLSEFQEDETIRLLPKCSHAFHIPCIDTWLASHTNCPMCRAGIVSNNASGPSPAPADDSGPTGEVRPEAEGETRIEIEDDGEAVEPDGNLDCKMEAVQPVRRSVSLDLTAALMISAAVANAESEKELAKAKESEAGRRSVGGNGQIGSSSSIKRSASCSAKVFLSRHSSRSGR